MTVLNELTQSHIYCGCCVRIRPVKYDRMGGVSTCGNFKDATDLMCSVCDFVIATMFNPIGQS